VGEIGQTVGVRTGARRRRGFAAAAVAALALLAAACVPDPPPPATGTSPNDAPRASEAAYTELGPHEVGVTTLQLSDRSVEVWYPADAAQIGDTPAESYYIRDFVPASFDALIPPEVDPPFATIAHRDVPSDQADGPYPLVIFSHGFASYRLQSTELTTHLASWGFVVISPDYLERGLGSVLGEGPAAPRADTTIADEAIQATKAAEAAPGGVLSGIVDSSSVYPVGHSAGGGTSIRLLARPDVHSAIPLSSGISLLSIVQGTAPTLPADKAIMWLSGRDDGIASIDGVRTGYDYTPGPKKIVELAGAGHNNAFSDICEIGGGGVIALAVATGLPLPDFLLGLGNDGCTSPPFTDSPVLWPQVAHLVTAELRYRSGLDPEPVGLGDGVLASLPNVLSYRHAP
jgi:dienelactone hydrolase